MTKAGASTISPPLPLTLSAGTPPSRGGRFDSRPGSREAGTAWPTGVNNPHLLWLLLLGESEHLLEAHAAYKSVPPPPVCGASSRTERQPGRTHPNADHSVAQLSILDPLPSGPSNGIRYQQLPGGGGTLARSGRRRRRGDFHAGSKSMFDLVNSHSYLDLTDQNLLGWYLCLSPEDRKIIQDEGGFQQFLHRHPALELSSTHVYVKHGSDGPVLPPDRTVQTFAAPGELVHQDHLTLKTLPKIMGKAGTPLGCGDVGDLSPEPPQQEVTHCRQLGGLLDSCQGAFCSSLMQKERAIPDISLLQLIEERPSWQKDLELDRQEGKPDLRTQDQFSPSQSEWPAVERKSPLDPDEASLITEDPSDNFYSIMEDDMSILACLPSEDVKKHNSGVTSGPVGPDDVAATVSSETLTSEQRVVKSNTTEKSTCDVTVNTEPPLNTSAFTQTEDPGTADKNVMTELRMIDLDYVAEKFMKMKMIKREPEQYQEKMKSLECKLREECERAQKAELCLLALWFRMCKQLCLSLCSTAEGDQCTVIPEKPPGNALSLVEQLEYDHNEMKGQILAGAPLKHLKPLSVGSDMLTTAASYIPAQIIADMLAHIPFGSEESHDAPSEESQSPGVESTKGQEIKTNIINERRAAASLLQDRDLITNTNKPEDRQRSALKEPNTSEVWYDAEEDLEPSGPPEATGMEQHPALVRGDTESSMEEAQSSSLCVSNLPANVTEEDVKLWFEKFQVSKVNISASRNNLRVAVVTVNGAQSAEAAARLLNGRNVQGRTLHVEHMDRATAENMRGLRSSQDSDQSAQTSETGSCRMERKLITAKDTFVPQYFGTMDSFEALMAELTERHPDIERQMIVDALMAVRAKHQGIFYSLPLNTIREMISELLIKPTNANIRK
ncbi:RNA-binding protein 44 [Antennarius striatus]|uniref:RNA-binding protein 44 n=1 Tax=Antennarius striatus TaxID=241820 RepID=UPI0035B0726E